jgi:ketosteroid isomerase-like protein
MTDTEAVRAANEEFYGALEGLDLGRMTDLWLHEEWVHCVHPGSDLVHGWTAVRTSWEQIFTRTGWLNVAPTNVDIRMAGEYAVVVCCENITSKHEGDVRVAVALATNIYQRTAAGWRMVHHHASPAPVNVTQPFSGTVQ